MACTMGSLLGRYGAVVVVRGRRRFFFWGLGGGGWYLNRLTPEYVEVLGPHHHEAHELLTQDLFDGIRLLDADADTQRVDRPLSNKQPPKDPHKRARQSP